MFSAAIYYVLTPTVRLAKGPLRHPKFLEQAAAIMYFNVNDVRFQSKLDLFLVVSSFALCFILMGFLPITGSFPIFFDRVDIVFVLFYLIGRILYGSLVNRERGFFKVDLDQPLVAAIILIFLFCILGIKKGGGGHVNETVFHGVIFSSIGSMIAFLMIFCFSKSFFFPKPMSVGGLNIFRLPYYFSKTIWFTMLVWVFFGVFPGEPQLNVIFYLLMTTALMTTYDVLNLFFPRISSHLNYQLMKKSVVPALLFVLLVVWAEEKIKW